MKCSVCVLTNLVHNLKCLAQLEGPFIKIGFGNDTHSYYFVPMFIDICLGHHRTPMNLSFSTGNLQVGHYNLLANK